MKKRLLSIFTALIMVCSFVGVMPKLEIKVEATTGVLFPLKGDIVVTSVSARTNGYYCDYVAASNTPVYAPADGAVEFRQTYAVKHSKLASYANHFVFTSADGIYRIKGAHLNSFNGVSLKYTSSLPYKCSASVYDCDTITLATKNVKKGELIGYTGMTGNASGPHLHLEVYKNGGAVNPKTVLDSWYTIPDRKPINTPIDTSYKTPISNVKPNNQTGYTLVYNVYGEAYSTSEHYIAPTDVCTINEVYATGFCKITYPTSKGNHTEYAKTADFNIDITPIDERFAPYMPLTAYLWENKTAYVSTGEIWATDKCTIKAVYTDGTCDVTYPTSKEDKDVRTSLSYFIPNTSANFEKVTASKQIYAYSRPDMAVNIGYTDPGDACVKVATSGDKVQIIYPISGGFKIGFVNASGVPHTHTFGSWLTTLNATCTANGSKQRKCSICGHTETQTINKLGHSLGNWTTKNATCTAEGNKTRNCSRCEYAEVQTISKIGHKYTSKVVAATCKDKGYTQYTCSVCKHTYKDTYTNVTTSHKWGNWTTSKNATCIADGSKTRKCSVCGKSETQTIAKLGHSMGDWTTKNATCTAEGSKTRSCTRNGCTHKETQSIAKTDHKYTSKVVAPTCTAKGYTEYTCSICKHTYKDNETAASGHKWGNWITSENATCTAEGSKTRKCSVCGKTETQTIGTSGEHKYTSKVVAPTCTAKGYTLYTCECGDSYKDKYTDMLSHEYGEWTVIKNPTCSADGLKEQKCVYCEKAQEQKISKTVHKYSVKEVVEATCKKEGYTVYECSSCGAEHKDDYVKPTGHKYESEEFDPGNGRDPFTLFTCVHCKGSYKDTVSKKHKGDFDKDGTLKVADAVFMKKILTKSHKPTSEEIMIADVNQDGTVNVFDMIIMKRMLINN